MAADKVSKVVEARMALRERYRAKTETTASLADDAPMGDGPPNRHGMPQVPPGQHVTQGWPVLDLGFKPDIATSAWRLTVDGAVAHPVTLDWEGFQALPQTTDVSDFHCVTTWSKLDVEWRGVLVADVLALAEPLAEASHLLCHGYDDYTTNIPIWEAAKPDVLLVHTAEGRALPREHGGPVRMITPQLWAWKGAKWIRRIEVCTELRRGFWEQRGYSATAHPWRDDRYAF
jgi:DMSO/TMAO reductase YedYZ molybdopterin-dependent catalytic subunit